MGEISIYEKRRMLEALEQIPPTPKFLLENFFNKNIIQSDTDIVDIDIRKGGIRVVPYIRPIQDGVVLERGGFNTNSYKLPYIRVMTTAEADKFMMRGFGDTVYEGKTPAQLAAKQFVDDMEYLSSCLDAEEERQAAEAVFTGKVTMRNVDGVQIQQADFGLENIEVLSPTEDWNNDVNFNQVLAYLRGKQRIITKGSGLQPTDIVMAANIGDKLIDVFNPANQASHISSIRVDRGQIDIRNLPNGVTYLGYFKEVGCDMWIYDGTYIDLDGATKNYAPDGMLAMLSRHARFDKYYGAVKNFHGQFVTVPRFPHYWVKDSGSARFVQLESAPLLAPHQVDAMFVAKVM